jgi:hypothetical protein
VVGVAGLGTVVAADDPAVKVSQIDGPRPSSATAPSIWYDAVATPSESGDGVGGVFTLTL